MCFVSTHPSRRAQRAGNAGHDKATNILWNYLANYRDHPRVFHFAPLLILNTLNKTLVLWDRGIRNTGGDISNNFPFGHSNTIPCGIGQLTEVSSTTFAAKPTYFEEIIDLSPVQLHRKAPWKLRQFRNAATLARTATYNCTRRDQGLPSCAGERRPPDGYLLL
jgi:hypothetical protein